MSAEHNAVSPYNSRAIRRVDYKDAWTQVFDERFDKYTCDGLSFEDAETRAHMDANDATDDGLADYLHDQWKEREHDSR